MYTFLKFLIIHEKLIQKNDVLKKLYVFLITYCKIFHPENPFYEKVKMTTKRTVVLESFIIVGSFDCDHTQIWFHF
jgi:hypothetical protein